MTDETVTYRDGVGIERCATCRHALRTATDEPLVSVSVVDVVEAVRVLSSTHDSAIALRFAQALGLSVRQIICETREAEATDDV